MGVTRYLADKSALARLHLPAVRAELEPLIMRALVGICGVTELEMLFSARNIQERSRMKEQLAASLDRVDIPQDIWDQAAEIQEALTEQAQHRSASIPDLIVAATARARGLEILHYDRDFDTIARYTEQATRWIVPPGTVLPPRLTAVSCTSARNWTAVVTDRRNRDYADCLALASSAALPPRRTVRGRLAGITNDAANATSVKQAGIADESSASVTSNLSWMQPTSPISTGCRPWTGHP